MSKPNRVFKDMLRHFKSSMKLYLGWASWNILSKGDSSTNYRTNDLTNTPWFQWTKNLIWCQAKLIQLNINQIDAFRQKPVKLDQLTRPYKGPITVNNLHLFYLLQSQFRKFTTIPLVEHHQSQHFVRPNSSYSNLKYARFNMGYRHTKTNRNAPT